MLSKSAEIIINHSDVDVLIDITYLFLNIAAESVEFQAKILEEPKIIERMCQISHLDNRKLKENVLKIFLQVSSNDSNDV